MGALSEDASQTFMINDVFKQCQYINGEMLINGNKSSQNINK